MRETWRSCQKPEVIRGAARVHPTERRLPVLDLLKLFGRDESAVDYPAGQVIFRAGDDGRVMYVVLDGQVDLTDDVRVVETADPGDIFGEMALIDYSPRSLTAVARTDCRMTPIDENRFNFLVGQTPFFALHVMGVMAQRLRRQTSA